MTGAAPGALVLLAFAAACGGSGTKIHFFG